MHVMLKYYTVNKLDLTTVTKVVPTCCQSYAFFDATTTSSCRLRRSQGTSVVRPKEVASFEVCCVSEAESEAFFVLGSTREKFY